jgi:hypothetical protein
MPKPELIPLADAACQLHLSWHAAWRRALVGDLVSERRGRSWLVTVDSVRHLQKRLTDQTPGSAAPAKGH